jgi:2-dehydro-3-deoxygalactonokinase
MGKGYSITIDSGTSNTRIWLFDAGRNLVDMYKEPVGIRNSAIDGTNRRLVQCIHDGLERILQHYELTWDDIVSIVASGMITSELGLLEVPHLVAPVTMADCAAHVDKVVLDAVCPLPILFIPGIKNAANGLDDGCYVDMDIMRGEETEAFALLHHYDTDGEKLLILPGSHNKFVFVDGNGAITGCLTTMGGEILDCLTHDTIIADAVGHHFVKEAAYDRKLLLRGYEYCLHYGLGRTDFLTRILSLNTDWDDNQLANYILGATLAMDIMALKECSIWQSKKRTQAIIAGNVVTSRALKDLLEYDNVLEHVVIYKPTSDIPLSAQGAGLIADLAQQQAQQ